MPDVVKAWKTGGYGTTVWFHELDCGHIVTARRRSTKPSLPCGVCDQLSTLPAEEGDRVDLVDDALPVVELRTVDTDDVSRALEREAVMRVRVADRLGVPVDSVRFVEDVDGAGGVIVTLFAPQVDELLRRQRP